MKKNKTTRILAQMAGLLSPITGGIVETFKKLEKFDSYLKLRIHMPGIKASSIKAEVKDNILTVQYFLEMSSNKMRTKIVNIVHNQELPHFIDVRRLSAHFSEGNLDIMMPFNEFAKGYNIELNIDS
ncbi:MAG: hypothetical protein HKN67_13630 [Saprospiraceae bacterium]|nr:hypothetical protein [Saprospiraceae bacterium]